MNTILSKKRNIFEMILFVFVIKNVINLIECRSISESHENPLNVKYFESKIDSNKGYWSPITSSIDWCERNYVLTKYIAEFWNCLSSLLMCLLGGILFFRGLYYKIETRFLLMSLSFGIVGLGSAYFHGTLTYIGQMTDELPMVYSMIIWWFILIRMNQNSIYSFDFLILFGIIYALLWTYLHTLKTFVLIFQIHFTLIVLTGIMKLIYLYKQIQYKTYSIMYLIITYIILLFIAMICWIIDQYLCEQMNDKNGFNPQFHAWWHLICAIDCHVGIVCAEGMRLLSIKYQQSSYQSFKPEEHLNIKFYFGLPFIDYSKDQQRNRTKNK
jgi:dihydroceramidase